MITGYLPSVMGRNTSARSTSPSSIGIGTSQSIRIPSRISLFTQYSIGLRPRSRSFCGRGLVLSAARGQDSNRVGLQNSHCAAASTVLEKIVLVLVRNDGLQEGRSRQSV